jgi:hypothetical protein
VDLVPGSSGGAVLRASIPTELVPV